jgi:hypothetical protein
MTDEGLANACQGGRPISANITADRDHAIYTTRRRGRRSKRIATP